MSHLYPRLASRLFDRPLLMHPDKGQIYGDYLAARMRGVSAAEMAAPAAGQITQDQRRRFGVEVRQGIAIIPVDGTLVHRSLGLQPYSGMRAYEDIQEFILDAATDPAVRGIILDIDSFGGEVSGITTLSDTLAEVRAIKPLWAVANDNAYSAAYWIGAAAQRLYVSRTSGVGSVGVIMVHLEQSRALESKGIGVKVFRFGARKADLNSLEPLTTEAIESAQAWIDDIGEMFVEHVAQRRRMSVDAVRATEAGMYHGADGVDVGFADQVGSLEDAHAAMLARLSDRSLTSITRGAAALHSDTEEADMPPTKEAPAGTAEQPAAGTPGAPAPKETQVTQVDFEKAMAAGRLEQKAYEKGIRETCALAGKAELAQAFIDADLSIDVVRERLIDARAKEAEADEIAGQHEGRAGRSDKPPVDLAAVAADVYGRYDKARGAAALT